MPQTTTTQNKKAAQAQAPPFLHVKGKSGLKHTRELLECWAKRPELPLLHAVGRFAWAEVEAAASAPNIKFYPRVTRDAAGPDRQTEHVSFGDVRRLQLEMPVHVCTSEREGFGHYINEARAAAAAVLSTDHPPMSELVPPESGGLLVAPARTGSYAEQVLGRYAPLNAYLAPDAICEGAAALAKLSQKELRRRGRAARVAYLRDRAAFLAAAAELRTFLEARRARVIEEERGGGSLGNSSSSLGIGSSINSNSSSNWGSKDSAAVLYVQQQQREQQEQERQKKLKQP
jgi:glycosyltransferase involved in cell wall biosynthesis